MITPVDAHICQTVDESRDNYVSGIGMWQRAGWGTVKTILWLDIFGHVFLRGIMDIFKLR